MNRLLCKNLKKSKKIYEKLSTELAANGGGGGPNSDKDQKKLKNGNFYSIFSSHAKVVLSFEEFDQISQFSDFF